MKKFEANKFLQALKRDLWVVLLDVVAVNASYYLALLIRFYVNSEFRPTVSYLLVDWASFAPWYTVICIAVLMLWRLYGGMWRYAGINDMNRIIAANVCTCVVQVVGTLIFVRRMPITYYAIGAVLQFIFIAAIRFGYRIFLVEKKKLTRTERIPALVIGSGDLGRRVVNHLEDGGSYHPVAIVGSDAGRMLNGTPVIAFSSLVSAIDEKKIKAVFVADPLLTAENRKEMQRIVAEKEVTIQDYTGYQANTSGRIPLTTLLSLTHGTVTIVVDGQKKTYENPEAVLKDITEKMDVKAISTPEITIQKAVDTGWNAWVENYTATTGQDISNL
ncbi:MAG: hypothetical protein IJX67_02725 [Oscillospiraceae bacterium]|nr:hypothetical protein [Prevotella sp.]MBQ9167307.1 hypothetical protein [Oscillospiraceae bacterium]